MVFHSWEPISLSVSIVVKGELAFNAHRISWQALIFREVIQGMHDKNEVKLPNINGRTAVTTMVMKQLG